MARRALVVTQRANGKLDKYAVQYVPTDQIRPSPASDDLYGMMEFCVTEPYSSDRGLSNAEAQ